MATRPGTADYVLEQLSGLPVAVRKMFGEYALYCDGKVAGLLCDDRLFLKIIPASAKLLGRRYAEGLPYPGAKPWALVDESFVEDPERLRELVRATADALPQPRPKTPRVPRA